MDCRAMNISPRGRALLRYLAAQGMQPSTWRGAVLLVSAVFGLTVDEEKALAIMALGMLVSGAIAVLFPDEIGKD